jgi:hypothetical protein
MEGDERRKAERRGGGGRDNSKIERVRERGRREMESEVVEVGRIDCVSHGGREW